MVAGVLDVCGSRLALPVSLDDRVERFGGGREGDLEQDAPRQAEDGRVGEGLLQPELVPVLSLGPAGEDDEADGQIDHRGNQQHWPEMGGGGEEPVDEAGQDQREQSQHGNLLPLWVIWRTLSGSL